MKRKDQRSIRIQFEPTRFARQHLRDSYERITPVVSAALGCEVNSDLSARPVAKILRGGQQ
jgi:hypothetical protein